MSVRCVHRPEEVPVIKDRRDDSLLEVRFPGETNWDSQFGPETKLNRHISPSVFIRSLHRKVVQLSQGFDADLGRQEGTDHMEVRSENYPVILNLLIHHE
jgi:hypothetical protein